MKFKIPFTNSEEQAADNRNDMSDQDTNSKIALQQDTALEEQLMVLLSNNHTQLVKLSDKKVAGDPKEGLRLLCDLVNGIVSFAEKKLRVNSTYLKKLLVNESQKYPNVKLLYLNNNSLSPDTVINLFKGWASHPSDRQPIFDELRNALLDIITAYFSLFESSFRSDLIKRQWNEIYTIHVDELKGITENIRF